jgi:catechol 2,3-dioxygenase-like lactoylglutathione lyase family enzyme
LGLFHTDSVTLSYSDVDAATEWWIDTFGCKPVKVTPDWDNPLP